VPLLNEQQRDNIIDDYQHKIERKIKTHAGEPGFPRAADYGVDDSELFSYLFDKQAIMDSKGSPKHQYTVMGVLICLPFIIVSAYPEERLPGGMSGGITIGLVAGLSLALLYKLVQTVVIRLRLRKASDERIERYIKAVLSYGKDD